MLQGGDRLDSLGATDGGCSAWTALPPAGVLT